MHRRESQGQDRAREGLGRVTKVGYQGSSLILALRPNPKLKWLEGDTEKQKPR
jgi:hypothetical protein